MTAGGHGTRDSQPAVSVVVVAYERPDEVAACLKALSAQTVAHEVIVVDNSASDSVVEMVTRDFPPVRYLREGQNDGYAGGNNRGLAVARGQQILVLNPDTLPTPDALQRMLETLARHPGSLVTAKLIGSDGRVNAVGNQMHFSGLVTCCGLGDDPACWVGDVPVFLTSGAAVLADRETWTTLKGFDPDFFLYMEDADLSLRARLMGREIWCAADAEILHRYALNMTPEKFSWLCRNRWFTVAKNFSSHTIRQRALGLIVTELLVLGYAMMHGPRYVSATGRALWAVWVRRGVLHQQRQVIQRSRTVSDQELDPWLSHGLPYGQLVAKPWLQHLLAGVTHPILRWMGRNRGEVA